MKVVLPLFLFFAYCASTNAQNVGIGLVNPSVNLHVDSVIKIGKNASLGINTPGRVNGLRFGDGSFVSISEDTKDDQLNIRMGSLLINKSVGSVGVGNVGINVDSASAKLDVNGSIRFSAAGTPGLGKVLTSDADGYATWQNPNTASKFLTIPFSAFVTDNPSEITDFRFDLNRPGVYMTNGKYGGMIAPVILPANSTIIKLTVYFIDNTSAANFDISLQSTILSGGVNFSTNIIAPFFSSGADANVRFLVGIPSVSTSLTGPTSKPYVLRVEPDGPWPFLAGITPMRVCYAVVEYQ